MTSRFIRILATGVAPALLGLAGACSGDADSADGYACTIGFGPVVTLASDSGPDGVDPGYLLSRDSRGNFYGDAEGGGHILKWAPDGRLLARIGRTGEGPGELAPGTFTVFVVSDSLYVRDNHMHWVVFDPELRFVRNASLGPVAGITTLHTAFFGTHQVFSSFLQPNHEGGTMLIASRDGEVVTPFATATQVKLGDIPPSRASAFVDPGRFWVGPPPGPYDGYRIEIWDTSGQLVDSIVRVVDWFERPASAPSEAGEHGQNRVRYPTVSAVWADGEGIVWTRVLVPKGPGSEQAMRDASTKGYDSVRAKVLEVRLEAWDTATKAVIASQVFPADNAVFAAPIQNSRQFQRVTSDTMGNRIVSVGSLTLTDAQGRACRAADGN